MKDIVFSVMLIAIGAIGVTHVEAIRSLYAMAYPLSDSQQQALDYCAASNGSFNRLDPIDRNDCYGRLRVATPEILPAAPSGMPRNDIRRLQSSQR